jgi:hypothetical protein
VLRAVVQVERKTEIKQALSAACKQLVSERNGVCFLTFCARCVILGDKEGIAFTR